MVAMVLALAVLGAARPAAAEGERYNVEVALVDLGALGLLGLAWELEHDAEVPLAIAGAGLYLFGAPAVHRHHDNDVRAGSSLTGRVVLPLVGALVGSLYNSDREELGAISGAAYGFAGGMVVASLADILVPAREPAENQDAATTGAWIAPVKGGGVIAGLGGSF